MITFYLLNYFLFNHKKIDVWEFFESNKNIKKIEEWLFYLKPRTKKLKRIESKLIFEKLQGPINKLNKVIFFVPILKQSPIFLTIFHFDPLSFNIVRY